MVHTSQMTGAGALDAFLAALAARGASPHSCALTESPSSSTSTGSMSAVKIGALPAAIRCAPTWPNWPTSAQPPLISSRVASLRSFYRHARREGTVTGDPWAAVQTPRLPRRLPAVMPLEDVEAVIDLAAVQATGNEALRLRDKAIIETAYAAGLRISELAGWQLSDLDPGD